MVVRVLQQEIFFIVDESQSSGVMTSYLVSNTQQVAQNTPSNIASLGGNLVSVLSNSDSDARIIFTVNGALKCGSWQVLDLTDSTGQSTSTSLILMELQAIFYSPVPSALIPINDVMTLVNGTASLQKVNSFRLGVNQQVAQTVSMANGTLYCQNYFNAVPTRLALNAPVFLQLSSPDSTIASNLLGFLAKRFSNAFGPNGLNCVNLLGVASPIVPIFDMNGIAINANITVPIVTQTTAPSSSSPAATTAQKATGSLLMPTFFLAFYLLVLLFMI